MIINDFVSIHTDQIEQLKLELNRVQKSLQLTKQHSFIDMLMKLLIKLNSWVQYMKTQ